MSDHFDFEEVPFDPATMSTSSLGITKAPLYRRPWFVVTVALVLVAAISVIVDLPRHVTKAQDAANQNATIKSINADIKPCAFAVEESFHFYNQDVAGTLTTPERATTTSLLVGDQTACSLASQPVYDLTNNIQPHETTAGKHIDRLLSVVERWITDYALASIEDIQHVVGHTETTKTVADLMSQATHLASERTLALSEVHAAQSILGIKLITPDLPVLPQLSAAAG